MFIYFRIFEYSVFYYSFCILFEWRSILSPRLCAHPISSLTYMHSLSLSLPLPQPSIMDVATGGEGLVVQEVLPIVHIGTTQLDQRTLTEEDGKIPFQVRKLPATEIAIIAKSTNPLMFIDGSKVQLSLPLFTSFLSFQDMLRIAMDMLCVKMRLWNSTAVLLCAHFSLIISICLNPPPSPPSHPLDSVCQ